MFDPKMLIPSTCITILGFIGCMLVRENRRNERPNQHITVRELANTFWISKTFEKKSTRRLSVARPTWRATVAADATALAKAWYTSPVLISRYIAIPSLDKPCGMWGLLRFLYAGRAGFGVWFLEYQIWSWSNGLYGMAGIESGHLRADLSKCNA